MNHFQDFFPRLCISAQFYSTFYFRMQLGVFLVIILFWRQNLMCLFVPQKAFQYLKAPRQGLSSLPPLGLQNILGIEVSNSISIPSSAVSWRTLSFSNTFPWEKTKFSDILRSRPLLDGLDFLHIHLDVALLDDMG